jgi:hypothetical protein
VLRPMSKAITKEEAREKILACVRTIAQEWSRQGCDPLRMCEGVAFSILAMIDGASPGVPAMDLVLRPHPDDRAFCQNQGTDFFQEGMVINDCYLHDLWGSKVTNQRNTAYRTTKQGDKPDSSFLKDCAPKRISTYGSYPWAIVHGPTGKRVQGLPEHVDPPNLGKTRIAGPSLFPRKRDAQTALDALRRAADQLTAEPPCD